MWPLPTPHLPCCPSTEHQPVTCSSSNAGPCLLGDFAGAGPLARNALQPSLLMADSSSRRPRFKFQLFWSALFQSYPCPATLITWCLFSTDRDLRWCVYCLSVLLPPPCKMYRGILDVSFPVAIPVPKTVPGTGMRGWISRGVPAMYLTISE